jgi:hypothetical protein
VITLSGAATVSASSGTLVKADNQGTGSGNTGPGTVRIAADHETLTGNLLTAGTSSISASLQNGTALTATVEKAALSLDSTSKWTVTGNSTLTSLADLSAIAGNSIRNIIGNGHTVTYDPGLAANAELADKTYTLTGGGQLEPA